MPNRATPRQLEILAIVCASILRNGYPPTQREVGAIAGIRSTNGIASHYWALEKRGLLNLSTLGLNVSRGVVPTGAGWLAVGYQPPKPSPKPERALARVVPVSTGRRCSACQAMRFVFSKPCFMCAVARREKAVA